MDHVYSIVFKYQCLVSTSVILFSLSLCPSLCLSTSSSTSLSVFHTLQTSPQWSAFIRRHLLRLKVVLVAPLSYYQLQPEINLHQFELPPGLLSMNEAQTLMEVYRRGGKLIPSSVHKLLRLGYKVLSQRDNVCAVTVEEDETLIVVGDIHGTYILLFLVFCFFLSLGVLFFLGVGLFIYLYSLYYS